jgi:uncharacterized membrane protein YeaQ/YmgE (transglycosylase-associated protein family)
LAAVRYGGTATANNILPAAQPGGVQKNNSERNIMSHGIIAWLVIGAIAGWLAGVLVKGGGFGLLVDILVGIIGAFIGGWLAGLFGVGVGGGIAASIVTATIGAVVLLLLLRLVRRA